METFRCNLRTMKLVILVYQLGLVLRADAQVPQSCIGHETYRPPEYWDMTVVCGTEYITLYIYLCPVYQALYTESLMVLNNEFNKPECFGMADWAADPPVLKFIISLEENSLSSCNNSLKILNDFGSGLFADFSNVQFVNISGAVTAVNTAAGMITYRAQLLYKFSCRYPLQYLLNNTKLGVSGASLMIGDNNGSFISTLSMELCRDKLYKELLIIPEEGLSPRTEIYVAVKATNLSDRFNVLLDRCYASTSPYATHSTYYDLFIGCTRDANTEVKLNGASQVAHFHFKAFRFMEHKNQTMSTFYLHCVTRLCEVSTCSRLLPDCSSSHHLSKREAQSVSDSTTVTSPAILVGKLDADVTDLLKTTDMPPHYPTLEENVHKSGPPSSLSCYSIPLVAVIVCNAILSICFSI
ncbi:zona pellucida-like domain-containing protein 1 [Pagrus major]|uniref:zona pellucida-like domain-containing protein 1 n=1 Tax=Pagrus major TaxID=143350 RepID=UPI003CC8999B